MGLWMWDRRGARARALRLDRIEKAVDELTVVADERRARIETALRALTMATARLAAAQSRP